MAGKTKLTPFARMFIFLLLFLPLTYIGAAYYNGEDPLANIKNWGQNDNNRSTDTKSNSTYDPQDEIDRLRTENADLKKQLKIREEEINRLKNGFDADSEGTRKKWGN